MGIRYKVVDEVTRCSIIIAANSSYILRYNKNTVVKALPNTLGIMVFKRRHQAEEFVKFISLGLTKPSLVLRVEVFSKGKYPKHISRWTNYQNGLTWFYNNCYVDKKYLTANSGFALSAPPKGTLCYDTVKVID